MKTLEASTQARLLSTSRTLPAPGDPLLIVAPCTLVQRVPLSKHLPFLLMEPHMGGRRVWLGCSLDLGSGDTDPALHQHALALTEPHANTALWGNPGAAGAMSRRRDPSIRFSLPLTSQSPWYAVEGHPHEGGAWLSALLMPRRCPAAWRLINTHILQLWIDLTP